MRKYINMFIFCFCPFLLSIYNYIKLYYPLCIYFFLYYCLFFFFFIRGLFLCLSISFLHILLKSLFYWLAVLIFGLFFFFLIVFILFFLDSLLFFVLWKPFLCFLSCFEFLFFILFT